MRSPGWGSVVNGRGIRAILVFMNRTPQSILRATSRHNFFFRSFLTSERPWLRQTSATTRHALYHPQVGHRCRSCKPSVVEYFDNVVAQKQAWF